MAKAKILVVDDDKNLLELMKMRLESANYSTTTVLNVEDALKIAKEDIFDLSLVDLMIDHKDGISLMEKLHLINHEMPVIILTGHGSIGTAVEAMNKGAFNYLTKPFDPQDLLFQIEKQL